MISSIQHFCENGLKRLEEIFKTYTGDLTKIAEMVYGVTEEVTRLGCSMIAEEWESYDELLRNGNLMMNCCEKERICVRAGTLSAGMRPRS